MFYIFLKNYKNLYMESLHARIAEQISFQKQISCTISEKNNVINSLLNLKNKYYNEIQSLKYTIEENS